MDLWGRIYLDHWSGDPHPHELIRDDGKSHTIASAADYFAAPRSEAERSFLATVTGRVLDLGCGPGSHTRFLEDRGVSVTAIDSSVGAITVCRERGCKDARIEDIDDLPRELGRFDAIICMGNTLGIGMAPDRLPQRLTKLRTLSEPTGRILAVMRDPLDTRDPDHLQYHARNRAAGRPAGLTRARLGYRGDLGDWWELWMPTEPELRVAAADAGWSLRLVNSAGSNRLWELTLDGAQR